MKTFNLQYMYFKIVEKTQYLMTLKARAEGFQIGVVLIFLCATPCIS